MSLDVESLRIDRMTPDAESRIMDYLKGVDDATVFHEPWFHRVIFEVYGHVCDYWVAREGGAIVGVFPVVAVAHPLLGHKTIALPYQFHSGPPLAAADDVFVALVTRAREQAIASNSGFFEIRSHVEAPLLERLGFAAQDTGLVKTMVPLAGLDMSALRRGHKKELKKALEEPVDIVEDSTLEGLERFRDVYLREGRALAGPQAGWAYFESLRRNAGDRYRLMLASHGSTCIGGAVLLDNGRTVFGRNGAYSHGEAARLRLSRSLIWRCLTDAAARGCKAFDLGVSFVGNQGLIDFKEGWRGVTHPVRTYVLPIKSKPKQAGSLFEGYKLAKSVWRRLPIPVVDRVGHQITRWIC